LASNFVLLTERVRACVNDCRIVSDTVAPWQCIDNVLTS